MSEITTQLFKRGKVQPAFLNIPTITGSDDNSALIGAITRAASILRPSMMQRRSDVVALPHADTLEERLYNSRASCKLRVSSVAMHLDQDWRERFFAQLDNLLNLEDWDEKDEPVTEASFSTLLRLLFLLQSSRRPGLGAAANGNIIAAWTSGPNRLTIECFPDDEIRWVIVRYIDDERESAAGQTSLGRALDVFGPYQPEQWFANEEG